MIDTARLATDAGYWRHVAPNWATHYKPESEESIASWWHVPDGCELPSEGLIPRPQPEWVEAPDLFYEAIGWTHAQCCAWLDEGKDPRTEDCGQLVSMSEKDFGIRAPKTPEAEWVDGLPSVGCECEYQLKHDEAFNDWSKGRIKFLGIRTIVMDTWPDEIVTDPFEQSFRIGEVKFRPIPAKAQRDRDELVETVGLHLAGDPQEIADAIIAEGWTKP